MMLDVSSETRGYSGEVAHQRLGAAVWLCEDLIGPYDPCTWTEQVFGTVRASVGIADKPEDQTQEGCLSEAVWSDAQPVIAYATNVLSGVEPITGYYTVLQPYESWRWYGLDVFGVHLDPVITMQGRSYFLAGRFGMAAYQYAYGYYEWSTDGQRHGGRLCSMAAHLSKTFYVRSSPVSMIADLVTSYRSTGAIWNDGIASSLIAQLRTAQAAVDREDHAAVGILEAFTNHVEALSGKGVTAPAAADLMARAQETIDRLAK